MCLNAMSNYVALMVKKIPVWIKAPFMVFVKEVGRMPFRLVYQHAQCLYANTKKIPEHKKAKILNNAQTVTYGYLNKKYRSFIVDRNKEYTAGEKRENFPIWILWWQGEDHAPEMVRRCIDSVRKNANGHPVYVIDSNNYRTFIKLEQHIIDKLNAKVISLTHFSDIIRMNLLAEHGGFWMDSTIFCTKSIGGDEFNHPIFTGRNPGADLTNISLWNWTGFAIYGWKGGKLFCLMRDFFNQYWHDHERLIDYFLIDYGIRLIYDTCPDIMNQINAIPVNNQDLYFYQQHFNDAYDSNICKQEPGNTWLYKLSWKQKYAMVTEHGEKTLYAAWCEERDIP